MLLAGCRAEPGDTTKEADTGGGPGPAGDSSADSAAGSGPDTGPPPDSDGDGVPDDEDCAPLDAAVYPGATDACDGLDNDCDGQLDEDAPTWHPDADADGHGDAATTTAACEAPAGWLADGSDCDDTDPAVSPAATEVCDDGIDNDCDGGGCRHEGVLSLADTATWVPDDFRLNPNDLTDESRAVPFHLWVVGGCDLDGDGRDDLLAAVSTRTVVDNPEFSTDYGELFALRGGAPLPATLQESWVSLRNDYPVGGFPACAGDPDGDSAEELVLPSSVRGDGVEERLLFLDGPWEGITALPAARAELVGASESYLHIIGGGGDADGDGTPDLVAQQLVVAGDFYGGVQMLVVPAPGDGVHEVEAAARGTVTTPAGEYGDHALLDADYDGDGLDDLVVSTYEADRVPAYLHVFPGPVTGALDLADATTTLDNEGDVAAVPLTSWRLATPGDVDGDGLDDLAAAPCCGASVHGTVYVLAAPVPGTGSLPDLALGALAGNETFDLVGAAGLGTPGDLDGDGRPDLAVSAAYSKEEGSGEGALLLWYGPLEGRLDASAAHAALVGASYGEVCATGFTYAVAALGDFDGDDTQDLAVSCKGYQRLDENDDLVHTLAGIWIVPGLASGL